LTDASEHEQRRHDSDAQDPVASPAVGRRWRHRVNWPE